MDTTFFTGLDVNFAPPTLPLHYSVKKIYKSTQWNSNGAHTPDRDESATTFACARVCTQTKGRARDFVFSQKWASLSMSVCVCVLRGEKINYLQTKTPDNAITVQARATALGKRPHYFF